MAQTNPVLALMKMPGGQFLHLPGAYSGHNSCSTLGSDLFSVGILWSADVTATNSVPLCP